MEVSRPLVAADIKGLRTFYRCSPGTGLGQLCPQGGWSIGRSTTALSAETLGSVQARARNPVEGPVVPAGRKSLGHRHVPEDRSRGQRTFVNSSGEFLLSLIH